MSNSRTKTFEVSVVFKGIVTLEGSKSVAEPSRLQYEEATLTLKVGEGKV